MYSRNWPAILLALAPITALSMTTTARISHAAILEQRENYFSGALKPAAQFASVPHVSSRPSCEDVQPPEAMATPNPLATPAARGRKVKVSFIIGTDGKVHSPLILESAGCSAIGMCCERCARGDIVLPPAMAFRPRPKARSSFPADRKEQLG